MSTTVEELLDAASLVQKSRNIRRVEVGEALIAINDEIAKQTTVDGNTQTVDEALTAFRDAAVNFKVGDDIEPIKTLAQKLFEAEGVRLVNVTILQDAIAVRVKETGEADSANMTEDAAIADFAQKANDYKKED